MHADTDIEYVFRSLLSIRRMVMWSMKVFQSFPCQTWNGFGITSWFVLIGRCRHQTILNTSSIHLMTITLLIHIGTVVKRAIRMIITYKNTFHFIVHDSFDHDGRRRIIGFLMFKTPSFLPENVCGNHWWNLWQWDWTDMKSYSSSFGWRTASR